MHELLVAATGSLECVWLPPRVLEHLARRDDARMVLFSLRHDRRALRRAPDDQGIDSVTLRFWGPRAKETLDKLRHSDVLPDATSVYSVRVRLGDDERYCLAEVFHTGKLTTVGTSFALLEGVLAQLTEAHADLALSLEQAQLRPRRIDVKVPWTLDDLGYGVARMFSGAEPFRLWGLPEQVGDRYVVRAVDLDVGRAARFEVGPDGVSLELGARTPASVAIRYVSALQYHVNASIGDDLTTPEPLLQFALPPGRAAGSHQRALKACGGREGRAARGVRALGPRVAGHQHRGGDGRAAGRRGGHRRAARPRAQGAHRGRGARVASMAQAGDFARG